MIREGFVSNSSSSSFILKSSNKGVIKDKKELIEALKKNKNERYIFVGKDLCDGWDVFELTHTMINMILNHQDRFIENADFKVCYIDPEEFHEEAWSCNGPDINDTPEDADDFEIEDLEDETLKKLLEKKRIFIDYRAIGHDYEDDDYAFMKGYFLTDEEWEEVENAEWSIDSKKKAFAVILYSGEYNNYEEAIATGRPITLVKNDFISQSFDFVPMIYMHVADKEVFPEKLSKNVKFYTDFKFVKFDKEVSMEIPFKIRRVFGIVTEVKRIKNFYKEEDVK